LIGTGYSVVAALFHGKARGPMQRRDADRAGQLQKMLADQPWQAVAKFAAHVVQKRSLHLRPWEVLPCSSANENATDARDTDAQTALAQNAEGRTVAL
jgi:hypothetical protein